MTISNLTIVRHSSAKTSLLVLASYAIGNYTQKEASKRASDVIKDFADNSPKRTPKTFYSNLHAYWTGLTDGMWNKETIFLYYYKGQFYTTNNDTLPGLFAWDTLPRECWGEICNYGGIYWRSNLTPYYIS